MPKGELLNYFFQRFVTRSLPRNDESFIEGIDFIQELLKILRKYSDRKLGDCVYYEFGAGWDLIGPFAASLAGLKTIYSIDIRMLATQFLIRNTISRLESFKHELPVDFRIPTSTPKISRSNFRDILKQHYRIEYHAPVDARSTSFPDASMNIIVSVSVMEHIPENDVASILRECRRLLAKGGVTFLKIDYQDHWSYFDKGISVYNFLKYSDRNWQKYSPSLQFQNRLRHKDYLRLILQAEFEILESNPIFPTEDELCILRNIELDYYFARNYSLEELAIKGALFVIQKK